ncbi:MULTISPECIES: hypothetical protein [unclassified Micromonospora]|uniref:hypothetical protein n=1 Tax=unclassified Micromonospora TaxID=2617518 RepID=UPI003321074B
MQAPNDSPLTPRDTAVAAGYGVAIWVFATAAILTLGPVVVPDAGSWPGVALVAALAVFALGLAMAAYWLYRRTRPDTQTLRLLFGTSITATGLLLDAVTYGIAAGRYPTLSSSQQGPVAFFLVFAYGALLIAPHLLPARSNR